MNAQITVTGAAELAKMEDREHLLLQQEGFWETSGVQPTPVPSWFTRVSPHRTKLCQAWWEHTFYLSMLKAELGGSL